MAYEDLARVEIKEVDKSLYLRSALPGLTLLVVGPADKGPLSAELITSTDNFLAVFGLPKTDAAFTAYEYLALANQTVLFKRTFHPDFTDLTSDSEGSYYIPKEIIVPQIASAPKSVPDQLESISFGTRLHSYLLSLSGSTDALDTAFNRANFLNYMKNGNYWTSGADGTSTGQTASWSSFFLPGVQFKRESREAFTYVGEPGKSLRSYFLIDLDSLMTFWGSPVTSSIFNVDDSSNPSRLFYSAEAQGYLIVVVDPYNLLGDEVSLLEALGSTDGKGLFQAWKGVPPSAQRAKYSKAYTVFKSVSDPVKQFEIWAIPVRTLLAGYVECSGSTNNSAIHFSVIGYTDPEEFTQDDYDDFPFTLTDVNEASWQNGWTLKVFSAELVLRGVDSAASAKVDSNYLPTDYDSWNEVGLDRALIHGVYLQTLLKNFWSRSGILAYTSGSNTYDPGTVSSSTLPWNAHAFIESILTTGETKYIDTSKVSKLLNPLEILSLFMLGDSDAAWAFPDFAAGTGTTLTHKVMYLPRKNSYEEHPALTKLYTEEGTITTRYWGSLGKWSVISALPTSSSATEIYHLYEDSAHNPRTSGDTAPSNVIVGVLDEAFGGDSELADNTATDFWFLVVPGTGFDPQVYSAALTLLTKREEDFLFLPEVIATTSDPISEVIQGVLGLPESSCAAAYFPSVGVIDPVSGEERFMPGAFAALIQLGLLPNVWQSPAGSVRGVLNWATRAQMRISKTVGDQLYTKANINPILRPKRYSPLTIWGARTLYKKGTAVKSALTSVNVRTLVFFVKRRVRDLLWEFPFELNSPGVLFNRFSSVITPFLEGLKTSGAVDAYAIVDKTTDDDRNNATFRVEVHLQPAREAEIIKGTIVIWKQGVTITF